VVAILAQAHSVLARLADRSGWDLAALKCCTRMPVRAVNATGQIGRRAGFVDTVCAVNIQSGCASLI